MVRVCECRPAQTDVIEFEISTTSGIIALVNLQAQIDGLQRQATGGGLSVVHDRTELIELVALRGQVLGRISDYEWAEVAAEQLMRDTPPNAEAFLTRARARGRFHRFTDALADLNEAQRLGANPANIDAERASVFQAVGHYEPALTVYTEAARRRSDFASFGALATLHADRGEIATAEQWFDESRRRYRGVSPFPLVLMDFQRGLMWLTLGELRQALTWFAAAVGRVPAYAPAQGHLAEVEAAMGKPEAAIARLLPLAGSSDDPDYAATLARVLAEAGRAGEAGKWRNKAAARYGELMARHPEAFADHAAEFWLDAGADPDRALRFARMNLEVRQTARARELLARAISATGTIGKSELSLQTAEINC